MARSNLFANIENMFEVSDTEEITEKTLLGLSVLSKFLAEQFEDQVIFMTLIIGAKLGVASKTGTLNYKEKALVDATFGQILNGGDIEEIYALVAAEITDDVYDIVETLTQMGNNMVLPFLDIVLGFAYIDKKVDDRVMDKLDELFEMNLLALFMESGLEEEPAP